MGFEPIAPALSLVESAALTDLQGRKRALEGRFCAQVAPKFAPHFSSIMINAVSFSGNGRPGSKLMRVALKFFARRAWLNQQTTAAQAFEIAGCA